MSASEATDVAEPKRLEYPEALIREVLRQTKTIAMVGASANWIRPSFYAMKYLQKKGYRIIPVNPREAGNEILGELAYASLAEIPVKVDMVQCFRGSEAVPGIVEDAKAISPKVLWMQLGVRHDGAAGIAEAAGMTVIMDRCPKIEYGRLGGDIGWLGVNTGVVSSRRFRRI